jgi:hypothetical protein
MNTFQVVNYVGHNMDPYLLTNYCAVEMLLRICCVDGHNIADLILYTQQDAFYKVHGL